MNARIEKVSAITLQVAHMDASVRFYRDVLGMEVFFGGANASFSSLGIPDTEFPIINLQLQPRRVLRQAWIRLALRDDTF